MTPAFRSCALEAPRAADAYPIAGVTAARPPGLVALLNRVIGVTATNPFASKPARRRYGDSGRDGDRCGLGHITAEPGPGNLPGNLLCGIARLLDRSPLRALPAVANRLNQAIRLYA